MIEELIKAEKRKRQEESIKATSEYIRFLLQENKHLEQKLEQTEKDLADYQFNYPTIKELEKTIKLLGERCAQLLKDKGELIGQIEKMKRCEICKHFRWSCCSYEISITKDCIQNKMKHFELKEIKENDRRIL